MLEFDEPSHTYRIDGRVVPSVTQVLKPLTDFSHIDPATLENARQEGVAIHKMVELDVTGDLDEDQLPDWLRGRLKAWRSFRDMTGLHPIAAELRMAGPGVAGTLDLVVRVRKAVWLVDLKRSLYAGRAIGLQTAAYARLWNALRPELRVTNRFALVLADNGTYRLTEFKDPHDDAVFMAALVMHNWISQGRKQ